MSKRILFSVLNWGLGHTTRSIPVIRHLLQNGHEVVLASDGTALDYLRTEFPELRFHELEQYNVEYHSNRLIFNVMRNAGRILKAVRIEHEQICRIADRECVDAVITDNRYGSFLPDRPSVIITHQLKFRTGNPLMDRMAGQRAAKWLQPFDRIWVPDDQERSLSGIMSKTTDHRARYVGWLTTVKPKAAHEKYDLLALLSGPEPQRTRLENIIRPQLEELGLRVALVRGVKGSTGPISSAGIDVFDMLDRAGIEDILASSEFVFCRSGYSSLMDLYAIGKRAILVPTPGQPEQEYLAERLSANGLYISQSQDSVDIRAGLDTLRRTPGRFPPVEVNEQRLRHALDDFEAMLGLEKVLTDKAD